MVLGENNNLYPIWGWVIVILSLLLSIYICIVSNDEQNKKHLYFYITQISILLFILYVLLSAFNNSSNFIDSCYGNVRFFYSGYSKMFSILQITYYILLTLICYQAIIYREMEVNQK